MHLPHGLMAFRIKGDRRMQTLERNTFNVQARARNKYVRAVHTVPRKLPQTRGPHQQAYSQYRQRNGPDPPQHRRRWRQHSNVCLNRDVIQGQVRPPVHSRIRSLNHKTESAISAATIYTDDYFLLWNHPSSLHAATKTRLAESHTEKLYTRT